MLWCFFFNDTATPELYTLSLHDALPILQPAFLIGDNEPDETNIFWLPMIAGNQYDGFMIGPTFHNFGIPFNKFGYLISPFFSFGREFVSGRSEEHTSELQSQFRISYAVFCLKKKK